MYIYVVEASIPAIILFCVIRKDADNLYEWKTFRPEGLHQSQISHADKSLHQNQISHADDPHAKSGSDEGLWAQMSASCINYQHLCELHKRE